MHHFSTIIKLSRTAVPLNMLLLLAIILVSAAGPSRKLIPWGFAAPAVLMLAVFTLDLITMCKMGHQSRKVRELFRIAGVLGTIGLCVYITIVASTTADFLSVLLTPAMEMISLLVVFINLMVVASVGRA